MEKNCLHCGNALVKNKNMNLTMFAKTKYCSRKCFRAKQPLVNPSGTNARNYRGGKISKKCEVCESDFPVFPKNTKQRFCSKNCAYTKTGEIIKEKRLESGSFYRNETEKKIAVKFSEYKGSAKRRKKEFMLGKKEFGAILFYPCTYCGEERAMGVDRINSSIGYIPGNVSPCCAKCNLAKHTMSVGDFKKHITKIYKYMNKTI
jgi:hypothetical protein